MSISQKIDFVTKNYQYLIKEIHNEKKYKEKTKYIKILIGNLINSTVHISNMLLSKLLKVSRYLINKIVTSFKKNVASKKENRGRKKYEDKYPNIINDIHEIVENSENIDSSLQDEIIYIDPTLRDIKESLQNKYCYNNPPSLTTISRMLKEMGYKLTKIKKSKVLKKIPETDAIFENINNKLEEIKNSNNTIIGISGDDKARKCIGNLSDGGKSWKEKEAFDHDTKPDAIVKPFGLMNITTKETNVYCTTSNSTARYKVDCLRQYLKNSLSENPNLKKVILFLDNGPENSSRRKLWIYCIINLVIELNIPIELAYYPPYHSKYNKIEHFWGVLQKHWGRLIIDTFDKLIGAINSTKYDGKNAKGYLNTDIYEKGENVNKNELEKLIQEHVHYENCKIKPWSLVIVP